MLCVYFVGVQLTDDTLYCVLVKNNCSEWLSILQTELSVDVVVLGCDHVWTHK